MNAAETSLKTMRLIHACFLLAVILYAWLPSMIVRENAGQLRLIPLALCAMVSLTSLTAALFFQARLVRRSAERLHHNPADEQAARCWRRGLLLSFVFSETLALLGMALRMLGAPWTIAGIFYALGVLLLLGCTPKLELSPG